MTEPVSGEVVVLDFGDEPWSEGNPLGRPLTAPTARPPGRSPGEARRRIKGCSLASSSLRAPLLNPHVTHVMQESPPDRTGPAAGNRRPVRRRHSESLRPRNRPQGGERHVLLGTFAAGPIQSRVKYRRRINALLACGAPERRAWRAAIPGSAGRDPPDPGKGPCSRPPPAPGRESLR